MAETNAKSLGLSERIEFVCSDWFEKLEEESRFDLVVSNPPYLTDEEWESAQPEVKPKSALTAVEAGLADLSQEVYLPVKRGLPNIRIWGFWLIRLLILNGSRSRI